jgi:hypothetical protein
MGKGIKRMRDILAPLMLAALFTLGMGCTGTADKLAEEALAPTETSLDALKQAKGLSEEANAAKRREAALVSDELTIALVLTANTEKPVGIDRMGDGFGCQDDIAYVSRPRAVDTGEPVNDALTTLFSIKDSSSGVLYNSLWQSNLEVEKVWSTDGVTTEVWLRGTVMTGGVCDDPRVKEQIEATVRQFRPKYRIILNGSESEYRCLGNMSGLCE